MEDSQSDAGLQLPVHRHEHPELGVYGATSELVSKYLALNEIKCGQGFQHEHDTGGELHHHHTLNCLVEAGKILNTEAMLGPIGEAAKLRFDLEMMTALNAQRERELKVLEPLVDMVGIWKDHRYKVVNVEPETVIAEFTDMVGRNLKRIGGGDLYEKWKEAQAQKFGFPMTTPEMDEPRKPSTR